MTICRISGVIQSSHPKVGEPAGYARFQSSYLTITEKKYNQIHFISKPDEQGIYGRRK
jgi:hypothetical protein